MNYRELTKKLVDEFTPKTQQLAINAIKRLRTQEDKRNYEGIYTALTLKDKEDFEKGGFGLLWKDTFINQVNYQIDKEEHYKKIVEESKNIDIDDFWNTELSECDEEDELPQDFIELKHLKELYNQEYWWVNGHNGIPCWWKPEEKKWVDLEGNECGDYLISTIDIFEEGCTIEQATTRD